ncbi:MAG: hypothetical protein OEW23_19720 [Candidatus Aminicenantes bacterium]|nr:hypothetical protein [Candidatus Aminicenantes bacterium]
MNQTLLITLLMLIAGLLGGITNYFRIEEDKKELSAFLKNILMGISAALLIPLFLNMISSNLLKESSEDSLKLFIFFGFCLIASLSSKAFIQTISDRVLNEVKKTKEKVENIGKDVEPIISKETEVQEAEAPDSFSKIRAFSFDEDAKKVLNSLDSGKYAWRSLTGIAQETGLPKEKVLNSLNWLSSNGLVVKTSEKGRWGLTLEGRDVFMGLSFTEKSKQKEKE